MNEQITNKMVERGARASAGVKGTPVFQVDRDVARAVLSAALESKRVTDLKDEIVDALDRPGPWNLGPNEVVVELPEPRATAGSWLKPDSRRHLDAAERLTLQRLADIREARRLEAESNG